MIDFDYVFLFVSIVMVSLIIGMCLGAVIRNYLNGKDGLIAEKPEDFK